jgi:hypothetical protein
MRSSGHAYSVRRQRESASRREAPHRLTPSRLVPTIPFDLWADVWRRKVAKGDVIIVRYADDLVMGFQQRADAVDCVSYCTSMLTQCTFAVAYFPRRYLRSALSI